MMITEGRGSRGCDEKKSGGKVEEFRGGEIGV